MAFPDVTSVRLELEFAGREATFLGEPIKTAAIITDKRTKEETTSTKIHTFFISLGSPLPLIGNAPVRCPHMLQAAQLSGKEAQQFRQMIMQEYPFPSIKTSV